MAHMFMFHEVCLFNYIPLGGKPRSERLEHVRPGEIKGVVRVWGLELRV